MATFTFQKPDKVIMIDSTDFEGKFEFRPLEPGYGLTVGNALRRVLLSSLEGFAITSIKIENVEHEFTSLPGIVEDVTEIILNLKQIRLKTTRYHFDLVFCCFLREVLPPKIEPCKLNYSLQRIFPHNKILHCKLQF
mgnify:CR=1 FL=1